MGIDLPKLTDGGAGMWGNSGKQETTFGTPATGKENVLDLSGNVQKRGGGNAQSASTTDMSGKDQGSGPADKPSPDPNLLSTISGNGSPDQGTGATDKPTPDQGLVSTIGKKADPAPRKPYFGGVEPGVQIQD